MKKHILSDETILKQIVTKQLAEELSIKLSSFKIENFNIYDDDLIIEIKVSLTSQKLPKDFMLRLVSSATAAIRNSGESRYAIIKPRLSRGQKVAA